MNLVGFAFPPTAEVSTAGEVLYATPPPYGAAPESGGKQDFFNPPVEQPVT